MTNIGLLKTGNIATSTMVELLLDERADRKNFNVRVVSSGAKLREEDVDEIIHKLFQFDLDLIIFISPDLNTKGPKKACEILNQKKIPTIVISDFPSAKLTDKLDSLNLGYIIIKGDPLIGARREFLDPTEMAIFNSHCLQVLSVCGAFRKVHKAIDEIIYNIKSKIELPKLILDTDEAIEEGGFKNPYAESKARAAYELAKLTEKLSSYACFRIHEKEDYIKTASCAHEVIKAAARLAEEAREIEKSNNSTLRTPHKKNGKIIEKRDLLT